MLDRTEVKARREREEMQVSDKNSPFAGAADCECKIRKRKKLMFTGIVEEIGYVVSIRHGPASAGLAIQAEKIFDGGGSACGTAVRNGVDHAADNAAANAFGAAVGNGTYRVTAAVSSCGVAVGDSICTNGVCLTATSVDPEAKVFTADVMNATLKRSTLGELQTGSPVDLERAMSANGRFGGHIVSGHIDGVGRISAMHRDDIAIWYEIKASPDIMKYVVEKGSIAIEGISLTVAGLRNGGFAVSVIPHTQEETVLVTKHVNSRVNLECDIIGKYVERFTGAYAELLRRGIG